MTAEYDRKSNYATSGLWKAAFMQECALAQVKAGIPPELIVSEMIRQYGLLWERIDDIRKEQHKASQEKGTK